MARAKVMSIVERKDACTGTGRRVWDVYHEGVSDVAVLEIVMDSRGLSVFADGNEVYGVEVSNIAR